MEMYEIKQTVKGRNGNFDSSRSSGGGRRSNDGRRSLDGRRSHDGDDNTLRDFAHLYSNKS